LDDGRDLPSDPAQNQPAELPQSGQASEPQPFAKIIARMVGMGKNLGTVAIIGGGWAGCTAAFYLQNAGIPYTLFEANAVLGGRARRIVHPHFGHIDNGQHLLLAA
ncbi:MAG: hypothetical protein RLZZ502_787, partial [Pseudomonadota bacterium]